MSCWRILKSVVLVAVLGAFAQTASADTISNIGIDTAPLVGHPAVPFSILFVFTDGDGIGGGNNTVTISNVAFGGGSALGSPLLFGGVSGSLAARITITDSSFLSLFSEQFAPGLQLTFSLGLTSDDDVSGTPDRLTFSILDSSGIPLPTLAPFGDYFLGVDLVSTGLVFDVYASNPSRAPTVGNPISISEPTINPVSSVPEPSTINLLGGALLGMVVLRRRIANSTTCPKDCRKNSRTF